MNINLTIFPHIDHHPHAEITFQLKRRHHYDYFFKEESYGQKSRIAWMDPSESCKIISHPWVLSKHRKLDEMKNVVGQ